MQEVVIYAIGLGLAFYIAWCMGANDAANPTASAVGGGAINIKRALVIFAIFAALGAVLQGYGVQKTIGKGISVEPLNIVAAFTSILGACIWVTLCSWKGIPISTTHSVVGAVMGYGLITGGLGGIYYDKLGGIFISVIASPLLSIGLAMALFFLFRKLFGKISESGRSTDNIMRFLLIFALCFSAYAFGANDVANATGVFATATESISGLSSTTSMRLLALFAAVGIAVGGFTLGKRVIDTGARRITKLSLLTGVSAGFSNAVTVYLFTTIPTLLFGWGVPVSTTHCSMGAIIGVGIAQGRESVDKRTVGKIILYWVITFPCVALLSAGLFKLAMLI